jgi:hypothetical protein
MRCNELDAEVKSLIGVVKHPAAATSARIAQVNQALQQQAQQQPQQMEQQINRQAPVMQNGSSMAYG